MSRRCVGCMKIKTQSPVCEHCGYNENIPNYAHQLPIGTVLHGQYTVGKVLGQGGFGITYIGWDNSLDAPVGIKEFYPNSIVTRECVLSLDVHCAGKEAEGLFYHNRERFLREAKILAKLQNVPGIVRVQNLFAENNTAYIVMEYVEGIDLKHYIRMRNRVLSPEEAFAVFRPMMYALSKVHEAELVHRDISPDNIMIQTDGTAKLLDFGAAREVADAEVNKELPQSTEAILKHGFAPMEQYQRRGTLGPWTDVYALCATLYYCLTGKVPADAPERIMGSDNVNWRQIPGLTEQQIQTLEKGLALLPENRIRTMRELHAGLFGQTATGFTQVKKEEPKPEPNRRGGSPTLPKAAVTEQKKAEKKPDYPTHTVSLESGEPEPNRREGSLTLPKAASTERKKKKPFGLIAAALAVVAAVGVFALKPKEKTEIIVPETVLETHPIVIENPAWEKNVLMAQPFDTIEEEIKKRDNVQWMNIKTVTILDTTENADENAWDVSEAQDGSVLAWTENVSNPYNIYIAADGGINAQIACENLFFLYSSVEKVNFNDCFHTDYVKDMSKMFRNCVALTSLDLSGFDTSNVTSMNAMFHNCKALEALDLGNFNTSKVKYMSSMFSYCESLESVDLSNFDTSEVSDMSNMFSYCLSLTALDLHSFNTEKVTTMESMFTSCRKMKSVNVSSFDTSNVTNMHGMFYGCTNLECLDLSNFDTSNVLFMEYMLSASVAPEQLELGIWETDKVQIFTCFMDETDTINGHPWEKLFEN